MGNKKQNQDADRAREAQQQADAQYQAAIVKSQEKTPIQLAQEKQWLNDDQWFNQANPDYSPGGVFAANGTKDAFHAPNLMFASAADQNARMQKLDDRAGTGLFQLGAQGGASPQLGQALKEQRTRQNAQQAGSDYVGAVTQRRGEHEGTALPLMNFAQNQTGMGLSAYGNRLGNATQRVGMSPYAQSPWAGIATAALGGAGTALQGAKFL